MNIVIIEDETPALNRIKKLVNEVAPEAVIIAAADSIESAVKLFRNHPDADLALFDIELADGQSFEIFRQVEVKCPVIFTTAYDEFALKAFKLNSVDYLLKPIDKEDLRAAIHKFKSFHGKQQHQVLPIDQLLESLRPASETYKSRFLLKSGTKLISVPVEEIAYFHAADKVVYVHTSKMQKYIIDQSLEELFRLLNPKLFFQLNRQYIAQIQSIRQIHTYFNGKLKIELVPPTAEEVLVSREKAGEFRKWLDQ